MTECEEVAESMRASWNASYPEARRKMWEGETGMNIARQFVKRQMEGECMTVIDNVAEALLRN